MKQPTTIKVTYKVSVEYRWNEERQRYDLILPEGTNGVKQLYLDELTAKYRQLTKNDEVNLYSGAALLVGIPDMVKEEEVPNDD